MAYCLLRPLTLETLLCQPPRSRFPTKGLRSVDLDKKGIEGHFDLDAFVVLDHTASIHAAAILIASTPVLLILIALVLTPLFYKT